MGKKDYGNSTIYLGLCIRRRGNNRAIKWTKRTYIRKFKNMIKETYKNTSGQFGHKVTVDYYRYRIKKQSKWIFPVTYQGSNWGSKPMYISYNSTPDPIKYYKYVRRAFLLPLTPTEAARGYKIFFDVFTRLRPLPNNDGVCGYILGNGIYYSSNCLRGKIKYDFVSVKLTSHHNPLFYKNKK